MSADIGGMYLSPPVSRQSVSSGTADSAHLHNHQHTYFPSNYWTNCDLQGQQVSIIIFFLLLLAKQISNQAL